MAVTENFHNAEGQEGDKDFFVSGDVVTFNDDATRFNVTLNSDLEADSVIVDNETKAYVFNGTGSLVGNTTLVKRGAKTLTINNENSYTGGTRISGGAIVANSLANANQPKGALGGVVTNGTKFVIENGAELRTNSAVTNGSPIKFETDEGGVINNTGDFIVDKAMLGTVLTKKGNDWMKLNVSNTSLNKMIVAAGTVQCINANTPAKTVEYQGGTLRENTGSSYAVNVPKGKQGSWYLANRSTYTNKLTGEGTITIYCVTEKGTNYYATRTPIQCNFADFEGTVKATSSLDDASLLRFTLNTSSGMPKGTFEIAAGAEVQNSGKTFHVGRVTGSGNLGGSCTFSNNTSVGANTWQVGNADDWSTNVKVVSNANFVKVGTGRITWGGASTNSGTSQIKEGELCVTTNGKLGTGQLTVAEGATLSGANTTSKALTNSAYTISGTLRPGASATASNGTLYFGGKNVTLNATSTLVINALRCATASATGCTAIDGIGTLTINGTIRIQPVRGNELQEGDSIRIFTATRFVGNPTVEGIDGIEWDASRISEGLLFVKHIDTAVSPVTLHPSPFTKGIYDLRGRLVRQNTTDGLKPGIYIVDGKKVIIK